MIHNRKIIDDLSDINTPVGCIFLTMQTTFTELIVAGALEHSDLQKYGDIIMRKVYAEYTSIMECSC